MALLGEPNAWKYALRAVLSSALFLYFRPWQGYRYDAIPQIAPALVTGLFVFVLWASPEALAFLNGTAIQELYLKWGVMPLGEIPPVSESLSVYHPDVCGWALTAMKLFGSAVVIAVVEEFFWRGFLYRWLIRQEFWTVEARTFRVSAFLITAVLFGFEHQRWLVGTLAGFSYGYLWIKTGNIWSVCLAHGLTNFCLGVYVVATDAYQFW